MAQISDVCNNKWNTSIDNMSSQCSSTTSTTTTNATSFILSINTDRLPLLPNQQQQLTTLTQNYITTIATIQKKKDALMQNFSNSKNNKNKNHQYQENNSINDKQKSMSNTTLSSMISPNQISSMWEVCVKHHMWKEESMLSYSPNSNHTKNNFSQNMRYHATALYAIMWTFEQGTEEDDDCYGDDYDDKSENGGFIEYEDEDIDYDAKEIVWKVL